MPLSKQTSRVSAAQQLLALGFPVPVARGRSARKKAANRRSSRLALPSDPSRGTVRTGSEPEIPGKGARLVV